MVVTPWGRVWGEYSLIWAIMCDLRGYSAIVVIANEPAERRRSAGEAAENSAARRIAYAKKFSIGLCVTVRCKM